VMGLGILTPSFIRTQWSKLTVKEKYEVLTQTFEGCKTGVAMPTNPDDFNKSIMKSWGLSSWKKFHEGGNHCSVGFDEKEAQYFFTPMIYLTASKSLYGIKNGIERISSTASSEDVIATLEGLLQKIPGLAEDYYQQENETDDPLV
jgi:hypothetical protein